MLGVLLPLHGVRWQQENINDLLNREKI